MGLARYYQGLQLNVSTVTPGLPLFPPVTSGLIIDYRPESIIASNGIATGWTNVVTGNSVSMATSGVIYNPANPSFKNAATVNLTGNNQLGPTNLEAGANGGMTIFEVNMVNQYNGGAQNSDGVMHWYLESLGGGVLDLWTQGQNRLVRLGLNSFGGTYSGYYRNDDFSADPSGLAEVIATRVNENNHNLVGFWINGRKLTKFITGETSAAYRVLRGSMYFGQVNASPNYNYDGFKSRIIVYDRLLSDIEVDQVNTYLKAKYIL